MHKRLFIAVALAAIAFDAAAAGEAAYEQHLADLVNGYRKETGLRPLVVDRKLATLAQEHSRDMAKAKRMSHDEFPDRVRRSGLAICVENVGWNYPTPQNQFEAWRKSPGHEHNMLDRRVDKMGIGVDGDYVTFMACGS